DEDEFPDLAAGGPVQRSSKPEPASAQTHAQPKLPKNLLDDLPENSPINIVQTPIPITTSVPKRAKSQRKKALAAALATAQEYSEISMEQKKLQEAFTKAAGKKSKTLVELDLGDMLAALEKQQQAMKARQLTNTKPLYCNQVLSKEIDESVTLLLQELVRFQERVYQKDPTKAKSKRRLVMGLREVTKHMKLHKIKCVIISPNCEKIQAKGGLDEALYNVIAMAREQEIPFVFALGRKALGRCVNKLVPVSVVGIFNYSGAEGLFNRLVSLTEEARKAYKDMVSALEQEQAEEALKNDKKVPHHMGHSRNHSAASAISFCSIFSEPISEVNEKEYETNWRSMMESSDALEPVETEPSRPTASTAFQNNNSETPAAAATSTTNSSVPPSSTAPQPRAGPAMQGTADRDEVRADDRLELASQSTETGSLDGSCRGPLTSSITSTTSTLVPGMLEEAEEEDEEEEDYTPEPISVEVPTLSSRIDSWVSKTLENLNLGKSQESTEEEEDEEDREQSGDEDDLDSVDVTEPNMEEKAQVEAKKSTV
ncbi:hypothetical protein XENOCAPTIV_005096, partial [Xenoophorus captivus]